MHRLSTQKITSPRKWCLINLINLGSFTVELSNGQIWHQLTGDTSNAHWRKPAAHYLVNIARRFVCAVMLIICGLLKKPQYIRSNE